MKKKKEKWRIHEVKKNVKIYKDTGNQLFISWLKPKYHKACQMKVKNKNLEFSALHAELL